MTTRAPRAARLVAALAIAGVVAAAPAVAQQRGDDAAARTPDDRDEQALQEVFEAHTIYVQDRGEVQFTLTPRVERGGGARRSILETETEYGITSWWQVGASGEPWTRTRPDGGPARTTSGALSFETVVMRPLSASARVRGGLGVEVEREAADDEASSAGGDRQWNTVAFAVLARELPRWHHSQLFSELGVSANDGHGEWVAGALVPVAQWRLTAELAGDSRFRRVTPGLVWHPGGPFELGLGVPLGVTGDEHARGAVLHLVAEF